jgi:hypothetical protein
MELGSVTLKRIGLFCFPIKHSTHTREVNLLKKIETVPINKLYVVVVGLSTSDIIKDI